MSYEYDSYLNKHVCCVEKAWYWILDHIGVEGLRRIFPDMDDGVAALVSDRTRRHDASKRSFAEYGAYDRHFYGRNKGKEEDPEFDLAWLDHIHANDHHWQHWVLIRDEGELVPVDMPSYCIAEMVCDWWSFPWMSHFDGESEDALYGVFGWYGEHSAKMLLSDATRAKVEALLSAIRDELDRGNGRSQER